MVPKIRFSCILRTWFPLRRSDDKGYSIRCESERGSSRAQARLTLGEGLAVSAFPLSVPV